MRRRLGNFLSGMETKLFRVVDCDTRRSLETSLVEWKRTKTSFSTKAISALGNFLSGMETRNKGVLVAALPSSPLETSLVEWKHSSAGCHPILFIALGNFLSGMETKRGMGEVARSTVLGNFLSGMETPGPADRRDPLCAPWKLP